jgi:hypothetical protein
MHNYYVGLVTHEDESKRNDIENNITQTLLSDKEYERNKPNNCCNYLTAQTFFLLLLTIFSIIMMLLSFHVISL